MVKKQWILLAVFLLLAAVYIYAFTDWGRPATMQISHAAYVMPKRAVAKRAKINNVNPANLMFNLGYPYRLTEVKVVRLADWQTNQSTLPLWHLISDSNSVPIKRFYYAAPIRGMKPAVSGTRLQALETNVIYRLFLTAGPNKGEHDFSPPSK